MLIGTLLCISAGPAFAAEDAGSEEVAAEPVIEEAAPPAEPQTIEVELHIYEPTSEDSGGAHYDPNSEFEVVSGGEVTIVPGEGFEVSLPSDCGVVRASSPSDVTSENKYTDDGGWYFNVGQEYDEETGKITIDLCKDWTSRVAQFDYVSENAQNFEYYGMRTAVAPTDGLLEEANNYAPELTDEKGVKPTEIEGYHYTGRQYFAYVEGGNISYVDPEQYGFAVNAETGEITGATPKLTGNEQFYVLFYYTKDGTNLKSQFFKYYYLDGEFKSDMTEVTDNEVGAEVDISEKEIEDYEFKEVELIQWKDNQWVDFAGSEPVKQTLDILGGKYYYERTEMPTPAPTPVPTEIPTEPPVVSPEPSEKPIPAPRPPRDPMIPKTGDATGVLNWLVIAAAALFGATYIYWTIKDKHP